MNYQLLDFDTELFGFGVAKILAARLNQEEAAQLFTELKAHHVTLVYWPADSKDPSSQQVATTYQGILGCHHLTYSLDLTTLTPPPSVAPEIAIYQGPEVTEELVALAMQAGTYSHFNNDPNFPQPLRAKLYRTWITNSVTGLVATRVLVIKEQAQIVAMLTMGRKNARGDIGLLAVAPEFRGRQFGTHLVQAALAYFRHDGFTTAQVATQQANRKACQLYERCGFHQEKCENFYHFWL